MELLNTYYQESKGGCQRKLLNEENKKFSLSFY